jgi:hypothetical protein
MNFKIRYSMMYSTCIGHSSNLFLSIQLFPYVSASSIIKFSCGHIVPPSSILTLSIASGPDSSYFDFTYESRMKDSVVRIQFSI